MIDAAKVFYDYLRSKDALTDQIATRLWAELDTPPKDNYKPSHGAALVFRESTGGTEAADRIERTRWQMKIYGATVYVRRAAYLALRDVLVQENSYQRAGIRSIEVESVSGELEEPETDWDFKLLFVTTRMKSALPAPV